MMKQRYRILCMKVIKIELPDLELELGKLHRYVLLDEEASVNIGKYGAGGRKTIKRRFKFWGR